MNPGNPYVYNYVENYNQQQIIDFQFDISVVSQIYIEIAVNIAIGDMSIYLISSESQQLIEGTHTESAIFLFSQLEPNSYAINMASGVTQSQEINQDNFPSHLIFTMKIIILPIENIKGCLETIMIPDTLHSPPFLLTSNFISIHNEFQQPDVYHNLEFQVDIQSLFRSKASMYSSTTMYMELINKNTDEILLSSYTTNNGEEIQIESILSPSIEYILKIYSNAPLNGQCYPFLLDLEIHPTSDTLIACLSDNNIPSNDFFEFLSLPYDNKQIFTWNQNENNSNEILEIEFEISENVKSRFQLLSNFLEGNFSISIYDDLNHQILYSMNDNQIFGVLNQGNYSFVIQRFDLQYSDGNVLNCIEYSLIVSYDSMNQVIIWDPVDCIQEIAPSSLNTLIYLSEFTDYQTHFERNLLLSSNETFIEFSTNNNLDNIYFHVFISENNNFLFHFSLFDQDNGNLLYENLPSNSNDNSTSLCVYLSSNHNYLLQINSISINEINNDNQCLFIPFELQLMNENYINHLQIPETCEKNISPPMILSSSYFNEYYQFTKTFPSENPINHSILLSINNHESSLSHIYIEISYNFLLGNLGIRLHVREVLSNHIYYIYPNYIQNGAFIEADIIISSDIEYNLEILDRNLNIQGLNEQKSMCIGYNLLIQINNAKNPECQITENLPNNLYSLDGGSQLYGGPQNEETGRIVMIGRKFPIHKTGSFSSIYFKIPIQSALRVYIYSSNSNILLNLYSTTNPMNGIEAIINDDENYLWNLHEQDQDYYLLFNYIHSPPNIYCSYFEFQLEIKSINEIENQIQCPIYYPSPDLPPSILHLNDQDDEIFGNFLFNSTILNDSHHHQTIHHKEEFYYRILLITNQTKGYIHSYIEYPFITSNFKIRLTNAINNNQIDVGKFSPSINTGNSNNFRYLLDYNIINDNNNSLYYYLDIIQTLNLLNNTNSLFNNTIDYYCKPFEFDISFSSLNQPHLMFIDPLSGENLNPIDKFIITFTFSESILNPSTFDMLHDNLFYLYCISDTYDNNIYPISIQLHDDSKILIITFPSNTITWGASYSLFYNISSFRTKNSNSFIDSISNSEHVYEFQDCDCNMHGICSMENNYFICNCFNGYTGDLCQNCAINYHQAGDECLEDIHCTNSTCNNHGVCHESHGYVHCVCDTGYSTIQDDWCSICSIGYIMNDNNQCILEPETNELSTSCNSPILPSSLDDISFLKYNQQIYLFDHYFIDLSKTNHEILFSLKTESFLSIFIGSIQNEINIQLQIQNIQSNTIYYSTNQLNNEKAIYEKLSEGNYKIQLTFLPFNEETFIQSSCSTIIMELEIKPSSYLLNSTNLCLSNDNDLPMIDQNIFTYPNNYIFYAMEDYSFSNHDNLDHFFYSYSFYMDDIPENYHAFIHIDLGYQFIAGDLGILLERETNNHDCINNNSQSSNHCILSSRFSNHKILDASLSKNQNYTIWLYHTNSLLPYSNCNFFNFNFEIKFLTNIENEWNCNAPRLPDIITSSEYILPDGSIHINDEYYLSSSSIMSVNVNEISVFRLSLSTSKSTLFYYKLEGSDEWIEIHSLSNHYLSYFVILHPSNYQIRIDSWSGTSNEILSNQFCETSRIEISLKPFNSNELYLCNSPSNELPNLSNYNLNNTIPFSYGIPSENISPQVFTYYFNGNNEKVETIYSISFEMNTTSQFSAGVASDFLNFNLFLELKSLDDDNIIYNGKNYYNFNYIQMILTPGRYSLSIYKSIDYDFDDIGFYFTCVEFNFQLKITEISNECLRISEPIPKTLNNLRFINSKRTSFNYFSPSVYINPILSNSESFIPIQVDTDSVLRIYVEPRDDIEIRIKLQQWSNENRFINITSTAHARSYSLPNSLSFSLSADTFYRIWLRFSLPIHEISCPDFGLHIYVGLMDEINSICPNNGGDHFNPPLPDNLPYDDDHSYQYDSDLIGENLYYQQITNRIVDHPIQFSLSSSSDIHVEVDFDFIHADLLLRFRDFEGVEIDFYGYRSHNRETIHILNIGPGKFLFLNTKKYNFLDKLVKYYEKVNKKY